MTPQPGWTIDQWLAAYRSGQITPRQALGELREQLDPQDPAWIHILTAAELESQLAALDKLGDADTLPLYGVPFVIKDNIDAAGLPTTAACPAYAYRAEEDATSVARLKAAGAVLLAKTNLDQFATGLVGTRSPYGGVPNTFDADYISGGSSSGSAVAVARGLVPFSLGTDTAGSGRVPAGFNNIVGLKPTRGRFSNRGLVPACRSLDCISVFALTVDDAETVAEQLSGFDTRDAYSRRQPHPATYMDNAPRLGIPDAPPWFGDSASAAAWDQTLSELHDAGVTLVPLSFAPMQALAELLYGGPWIAERHAAIAGFLAEKGDTMNEVVRGIIAQGQKFTATDAYRAEYRRAELVREIQTLLQSVDALVVPTAPRLPTFDAVAADPIKVNSQLGTWTNFVNLCDLSALALPAGLRSDGLPFGITLIAGAWQDAALAEFGRRWQAHRPWTLGATGRPAPEPSRPEGPPPGYLRLAVVGAHLRDMPLNHQLTERRARFVEATSTAAHYRLYALPGTTPPKPGLVYDTSGDAIAVELWDLPIERFGSFVALIPAPLGIGTLTLADGRQVKGFICEGAAIEGATDITHLGGWRPYVQALANE